MNASDAASLREPEVVNFPLPVAKWDRAKRFHVDTTIGEKCRFDVRMHGGDVVIKAGCRMWAGQGMQAVLEMDAHYAGHEPRERLGDAIFCQRLLIARIIRDVIQRSWGGVLRETRRKNRDELINIATTPLGPTADLVKKMWLHGDWSDTVVEVPDPTKVNDWLALGLELEVDETYRLRNGNKMRVITDDAAPTCSEEPRSDGEHKRFVCLETVSLGCEHVVRYYADGTTNKKSELDTARDVVGRWEEEELRTEYRLVCLSVRNDAGDAILHFGQNRGETKDDLMATIHDLEPHIRVLGTACLQFRRDAREGGPWKYRSTTMEPLEPKF